MGAMKHLLMTIDELTSKEMELLKFAGWKLVAERDSGGSFSEFPNCYFWKNPRDGKVYDHDEAIFLFKRQWKGNQASKCVDIWDEDPPQDWVEDAVILREIGHEEV